MLKYCVTDRNQPVNIITNGFCVVQQQEGYRLSQKELARYLMDVGIFHCLHRIACVTVSHAYVFVGKIFVTLLPHENYPLYSNTKGVYKEEGMQLTLFSESSDFILSNF